VLFGCYHETFRFLRRIGTESDVHVQPRLAITVVDRAARASRLVCPRLPSPLHLAAGVMRWDALAWRDRVSVLRMGRVIRESRRNGRPRGPRPANTDETVRQWLVRHGQTDRLIELLEQNPSAGMATLATPLPSVEQLHNPACVKVVFDDRGRAMNFSRSPIPIVREPDDSKPFNDPPIYYQHLGIYAYRRNTLLELASLPPTSLEQAEKLEQLRTLQHGGTILVGVVHHAASGIDTLLRAVITPNAAKEAGYRAFRVELKDGDILDGFLVSQNDEAIILRQPNAQDRRIPQDEIRRAAFTKTSLMPEGLLEGLPEKDATDLLAYLQTLK
jgi:putative heme-binding domain-containing protein